MNSTRKKIGAWTVSACAALCLAAFLSAPARAGGIGLQGQPGGVIYLDDRRSELAVDPVEGLWRPGAPGSGLGDGPDGGAFFDTFTPDTNIDEMWWTSDWMNTPPVFPFFEPPLPDVNCQHECYDGGIVTPFRLTGGPTATPEPGSFALLGLGLISAGLLFRRKRA